MDRPLCRIAITVGFVLLAAGPGGTARGGEAAETAWDPGAAAQYLDGRADWWLGWSGSARGQGTACLSCHTSMPIALARPALGARLGEKAPGTVEARLIDGVKKRVESWEKVVADGGPEKDPFRSFYSKERKPSALGTESVLNALILVNHDSRRGGGALGAPTRKALGHLWEQQKDNGAWLWLDFGLNPWEKDGAYYGASLAAVAVGTAGRDYYDRPDVQAKVTVLKSYLRTPTPNQPLHHRALGLWASTRLPGILDEAGQKELVDELWSVQEADGGWSLARLGKTAAAAGNWKSQAVYPEGLAGDGYATGLAVLALKGAGVAAEDPRLKKAVGWLLTHQKDGSWPASYLNRKRDPQEDIGKFMRDAATAFAALALTETPGHAAGKADEKGSPPSGR
jgi:squalene-hopene/tetraprenyl-beta-curcumene cyclase